MPATKAKNRIGGDYMSKSALLVFLIVLKDDISKCKSIKQAIAIIDKAIKALS